jgi:hypothetical protein
MPAVNSGTCVGLQATLYDCYPQLIKLCLWYMHEAIYSTLHINHCGIHAKECLSVSQYLLRSHSSLETAHGNYELRPPLKTTVLTKRDCLKKDKTSGL